MVLDTVGWCKLKSKLQALGAHRGRVFDGRIRGELSSVDGGRAADYCAADGGRAAASELHYMTHFIYSCGVCLILFSICHMALCF